MSGDKWGVGNAADSKAWGTARVGDTVVELIHGEHPHSRRDDTTYARFPDGSIDAFSGHRVQVRVEVETSNYLKTSYLSGDEVRRSCSARVFFDDRLVYSFGGRDPEPLLHRAAELIPRLFEHPSNLAEGVERLEGRPIFYRETPAVIRRYLPDQGALVVEPAEGHRFPRSCWQEDDDEDGATFDKPDLFSDHVWWFRDVEKR